MSSHPKPLPKAITNPRTSRFTEYFEMDLSNSNIGMRIKSEISSTYQSYAKGTSAVQSSAPVGVERKNTDFDDFLSKEKMGTWEAEDKKAGKGCWGR
jgi:hypothetical protein